MSAAPEPRPAPPAFDEMAILHYSWKWLLILGVALIILGLLAIGAAFITTLTVVFVFAILLLLAGGGEVALAIWSPRWRGLFLHLLCGALYIIVGAIMLEHPIKAAAGLTLVVAAVLMVNGAVRIGYSLSERFTGWLWVLVSGVITLILGLLIWRRWPEDALWVIGLFVGLEMLFNGWSCVMLALFFRQPGLTQR